MSKSVSELWEDIFADKSIIKEIEKCGFYIISAHEIKKYKEPRLMAKFDFSKQLPKIFKDNHLGILPIKNGEYIIGRFNLFQNISKTKYEEIKPLNKELPNFIQTIDPDNIYSESNALNVALLSGMIDEVVGEKVLETIQGKMRAFPFEFKIQGKEGTITEIKAEKPAMEIDGGYEGINRVALIEAKNSMPEDFIIRQLYYPYRFWKNKITKEIIPIFFSYDNGIYTFFVYKFDDEELYNSLNLQKICRFIITNQDSKIIKKQILDAANIVTEMPQNIIPFPQANSFTKIINILELIDSGINTANKVSEELEFEPRQGNYYLAAAKYLGLVTKGNDNGEYVLTAKGIIVIDLSTKERNRMLIEMILKHKPFYNTYKYYIENDMFPDIEIIMKDIKDSTNIENEAVIKRRASTVKGWVNWIIGCQA